MVTQKPSLPSFNEIFGNEKFYPLGVSSRPSSQDTANTSTTIPPPALSRIYCPRCTSEEKYVPVSVGDTCRRCHEFVPSKYDRPQDSVPRVMDAYRATTERELDVNRRNAVSSDPVTRIPWTLPFRATGPINPLPNARNRYPRRQSKAKDPYLKNQSKIQHSDKEKWRRDKISVYTDHMRIMLSVLDWPGDTTCTVKVCSKLKDLIESSTSSPNRILKDINGNRMDCSNYARNSKDESKSVVLFNEDLWKFSFAIHYQRDKVPLIIEKGEELIDRSLDSKEKNMNQKRDEKAREQGERDITGREAYDVLVLMLEQCKGHGIELDEGIAGRQEERRVRMGMGMEEGETIWGEGRGTPGSSRSFSEYEGEMEGDDGAEKRDGKRHRSIASEGSHTELEDAGFSMRTR